MIMRKSKKPSHENVDEITIQTDKLKLELKDFIDEIEGKGDWLGWLGVFVSLGSTLFFTNFQPILSLSSDTVKSIYFFSTVVSGGMFLKSAFMRFRIRGKNNINYIMDQILMKSTTAYEFRVLYIIKRGYERNYRILVFRDTLYDCFMLPHNLNVKDYSEVVLKRKLSEYLNIPSTFFNICFFGNEYNKITKKYSEFHKRDTLYNFTFCFVRIKNPPEYIYQDTFTINGLEFAWMSYGKLEQDENTRVKNGDVIRHIDDHCEDMIFKRKDSI